MVRRVDIFLEQLGAIRGLQQEVKEPEFPFKRVTVADSVDPRVSLLTQILGPPRPAESESLGRIQPQVRGIKPAAFWGSALSQVLGRLMITVISYNPGMY